MGSGRLPRGLSLQESLREIMKRLITQICVLICFLAGVASAENRQIGPDAAWNPGSSFRQRVLERCSAEKATDFGACFVTVMKDSGAPSEAIAFTHHIGNTGYMTAFQRNGTIAIARVFYPFRANENYGCYLVNGDPPVIDIDDNDILKNVDLTKHKVYGQIARNFPKVSLWPGDRYGADCVKGEDLSEKGMRFIAAYRLQDGCHACELLGTVLIAFDFESSGTFVGAKLLEVTSTLREFNDPSLEIEVAPGQHFTLVLDSNATTGYLWEIISPKESTIIKLVGSEYRKSQTGLIGAAGKEVWTFEATGKGKTEIIFKYIRPWEKDMPPAKTVTFKVNIKG